jgi:hypothetical protein
MSEHRTETDNEASGEDSVVDAVAAVVLILLAVSFCIYYVSHL